MRLFRMLLATPALLAQSTGVYTVDIPPAPGETFAQPCRFELTIPAAEYATRAVFVLYDRGRESRAFYDGPSLFQFAERRRLALLWARHCPTADTAEIDPDPAHGSGRALLTALERLEHPSRHGELSTSKLIVLGGGAAASLAARLSQFAPDRVLAAIAHAPTGFETLQLPPPAAAIPQLVVANTGDTAAGTRQPFRYFQKHLSNGAPWVFAIQRADDAALSGAGPLLFAWIEALLEAIPDTTAPVSLATLQRTGWWLFLRLEDSGLKDESGLPIAVAAGARIAKAGQSAPAGYQPAGWVPTRKAAENWQSFVKRGR